VSSLSVYHNRLPQNITSNWRNFRDQLCSMAFTLSNLYFVGCVYAGGFDSAINPIQRCGSSSTTPISAWSFAFILAALPNFIRLVQSIRRYYDSKMILHLVNVREIHKSSSTSSLISNATIGREIYSLDPSLFIILPMESSGCVSFVKYP
jgi:hypothetical protein